MNSSLPPIRWANPSLWGFLGIQLGGVITLALILFGGLVVTLSEWLLCFGLLFGRGFFIAAGYHRYFSHRSYSFRFFPRFWQFLFALGGASAVQKGPLWWAATHRDHHRYTDRDKDPHSPKLWGWLEAHFVWVLRSRTPEAKVPEFERYPELRLLERFHFIPGLLLLPILFFVGGLSTLLVAGLLSTTLLYHFTFLVNSAAHMWGSRRYETPDTSRNCAWITPFVLGEQWHNNHHHRQARVRQGEKWWEFDPTFYILWLMQLLGITRLQASSHK